MMVLIFDLYVLSCEYNKIGNLFNFRKIQISYVKICNVREIAFKVECLKLNEPQKEFNMSCNSWNWYNKSLFACVFSFTFHLKTTWLMIHDIIIMIFYTRILAAIICYSYSGISTNGIYFRIISMGSRLH